MIPLYVERAVPLLPEVTARYLFIVWLLSLFNSAVPAGDFQPSTLVLLPDALSPTVQFSKSSSYKTFLSTSALGVDCGFDVCIGFSVGVTVSSGVSVGVNVIFCRYEVTFL